ncbi:MarR family transcriptional regulator [Actinosynnema sp. CA-299493]
MSSKTRTRETHTTPEPVPAPILRSVPDRTTVVKARTDVENKLWAALHANPNSTAADLAETAAIGRSTAQKLLVKWANDGSLTRTLGIANGGRRAADLWAITETDTDPTRADHQVPTGDVDTADTTQAGPPAPIEQNTPDTIDAAPDDDHPTEPTNTTPTDVDQSSDDDRPADDGPTGDRPVQEQPVAELGDVPSDDPPATAEKAQAGVGSKGGRLASGALRGLVEDYLREHSGQDFSPNTVGKALNRSAGAVHNALEKLAAGGYAVRTSDKPKKYALAPTSDDSAVRN